MSTAANVTAQAVDFFARHGIALPAKIANDDAPHKFKCGARDYQYQRGVDCYGVEYLGVSLIGGIPIVDFWRFPEFTGRRDQAAAADPTVTREIARYRRLFSADPQYSNATPEVKALLWRAAGDEKTWATMLQVFFYCPSEEVKATTGSGFNVVYLPQRWLH